MTRVKSDLGFEYYYYLNVLLGCVCQQRERERHTESVRRLNVSLLSDCAKFDRNKWLAVLSWHVNKNKACEHEQTECVSKVK